MERSLSLFLPVHNAEETLARNVSGMLDVLTDLTDRFEVLIIDDGSTDGTDEVAHDLSRRYPQVRVARHEKRCGLAKAIQTGMQQTSGDIVFLRDAVDSMETDLEGDAIATLWRLRSDDDVAIARKKDAPCGIQMIRRDAAGALFAREEGSGNRQPHCVGGTSEPSSIVDPVMRDVCFSQIDDYLPAT